MSGSSKLLSISTLQDIDGGKPATAINHALRQIANDVIDRPNDKAKRKVLVQIEMSPMLDSDLGTLDTIAVGVKVKTTVPVRQSLMYPMLPLKDGRLSFEPRSPFDPRQGALFSEDPANETIDPETGEVKPAPGSDGKK